MSGRMIWTPPTITPAEGSTMTDRVPAQAIRVEQRAAVAIAETTTATDDDHLVTIVGHYHDPDRIVAAIRDGRSFYHLHADGRDDLIPDFCRAECDCGGEGGQNFPTMFEARWWCREHMTSAGLPCQPRIPQRYVLEDQSD